jgi:hypothetical protein
MPKQTAPWEHLRFIVGYEDPPADPPPDPDEGEEGEADDDDEVKIEGEENVDNLKKALAAERKLQKQTARELKRAQRKQQTVDDKEASDLQKLQTERDAEKARTQKLASSLLKNAVDLEITKAARGMKFRDPDDALSLINRDDLAVDQDEEDPSDIDIDSDTVEAALKKLAEKKPHLLIADGDDDASAPKFGGKKVKTPSTTDPEYLRGQYPALRKG